MVENLFTRTRACACACAARRGVWENSFNVHVHEKDRARYSLDTLILPFIRAHTHEKIITYIPPAPLVAQGSCLDGVLLAPHRGHGASTLAQLALEAGDPDISTLGLVAVDHSEPDIVLTHTQSPLSALLGSVDY